MTRRCVLFTDAYPASWGGAQMTLLELATGLQGEFEVAAATVAEGISARRWRGAGLAVHVVPYAASLQRHNGELATGGGPLGRVRTALVALRHALAVRSLVREQHVDVVYCSNVRSVLTFGVGARLAHRPVVWYVQQVQTPFGRAQALAERVATHVVSLSSRTDAVFPDGLPAGRSSVIPLGLDLAHWTSLPTDLPSGPPVNLVVVGQIHPDKGLDVVIDALAVSRARQSVHLRVVGAAVDEEGRRTEAALRERADRLGVTDRIEWLGRTDGTADVLAGCHLLVSGSRREGLPRSMMEAMALGRPVVTTDVGAVRDLVVDGVTGSVVPVDDAVALAAAIDRYVDEPTLRARHGAAARQHVIDGFDLAATVRGFGHLLTDTANGRAANAPAGAVRIEAVDAPVPRVRSRRVERFRADHWVVGLLDVDPANLLDIGRTLPARWLPGPRRGAFLADPFLLSADDLICEEFTHLSATARLVRVPLTDDGLGAPQPVDVDAEHVSYPFVVRGQDRTLVVPERSFDGGAHLYELVGSRLEHVAALVEHEPLLDSTLLEHEGAWYLFASTGRALGVVLRIWIADSLDGPWREHPSSPISGRGPVLRPAGRFLTIGDVLVRPSQDSTATYGGRVLLNVVEELTPTSYRERAVAALASSGRYGDGLHTIDVGHGRVVVDAKRRSLRPDTLVGRMRRRRRRARIR